jgi:hypothetical protein
LAENIRFAPFSSETFSAFGFIGSPVKRRPFCPTLPASASTTKSPMGIASTAVTSTSSLKSVSPRPPADMSTRCGEITKRSRTWRRSRISAVPPAASSAPNPNRRSQVLTSRLVAI